MTTTAAQILSTLPLHDVSDVEYDNRSALRSVAWMEERLSLTTAGAVVYTTTTGVPLAPCVQHLWEQEYRQYHSCVRCGEYREFEEW